MAVVTKPHTGKLMIIIQAILLLAWFFFLPNAPYLVTDFAYLDWEQHDSWQRLSIFTTFSLTGLMLAMTSLIFIETHLTKTYGKIPALIVVIAAILLSGFGVFIGRFLRWNS